MVVAVFSAGCGGSGSRAVPPAGISGGSHGTEAAGNTAAVVPVPRRFHKMAPLRMVNDPPARFEYAYEAEIVCTTGPADPDIDNDNDIDTVPPGKRGPIVAPQRNRSLPVGEFTLATKCLGETPTPSPSPVPSATPTPPGRTGIRSTTRGTAALVVPVPTPTATPATSRAFYVIQVDLANRRNPTVVSGPAAVAYDALNFAAAATPLQLTAGHRYVFALAYQDTLVTPSPTPSPTDTPSPVPTDSPTPGPTDSPTPTPTISPCPGAVAIAGEGTYCSWAVPHPPVDMSLDNPDIMYSSSTGAVLGRFNTRDHSTRELAIPGTPYALTGGHKSNLPGTFVGIDSPANAFGFNSSNSVAALDLLPAPPHVPASPHNIAGEVCAGSTPQCASIAIANGDVFLYDTVTQSIFQDFALTNPAASASLVQQYYVSQDFDILALTPDRHVVWATMDQYGTAITEHLLPVVLPAGYRFTGAARNKSGFHFVASDYQYGSAPQGHGMHVSVDFTTFTPHNVPFDSTGGTCDAMGIYDYPASGWYYISCVNAARQYFSGTDVQYHNIPVPADGSITFQFGAATTNADPFFTSYATSSIIELENGIYYPSVTPQSTRRAATTRRH